MMPLAFRFVCAIASRSRLMWLQTLAVGSPVLDLVMHPTKAHSVFIVIRNDEEDKSGSKARRRGYKILSFNLQSGQHKTLFVCAKYRGSSISPLGDYLAVASKSILLVYSLV